tara:strand:- start:358 stop:654 length:297 start_codon:yes stop_codon:yes gene_type:complete
MIFFNIFPPVYRYFLSKTIVPQQFVIGKSKFKANYEGLLVNMRTVPRHDIEKLKSVVFSLDENSAACVSANIKGFVHPANYDKLKNVMKELKVHEFKK